jgi:hypothetical protein
MIWRDVYDIKLRQFNVLRDGVSYLAAQEEQRQCEERNRIAPVTRDYLERCATMYGEISALAAQASSLAHELWRDSAS